MILEWLREGRAEGDCLVAPEHGAGWYRLTEVFPQADRDPAAGRPMTRTGDFPPFSSTAAIPASGLLELLDHGAGALPRRRLRVIQGNHAAALKALEKESALAGGLIRPRGSRLIWLEQQRAPREIHRGGAPPMRSEAATVAAYLGPQGGEFYTIIPWSRLGRLPHEFLSILPGRLPAPVALRRANEDSFAGGRWIGITGDDRDVMALAAGSSREALAQDIAWEWRSDDRLYQMVLVWGVQAVPLGGEKFAHLVQTSARGDPQAPAGLRWYLERQSAFYRFARRLSLPGTPGSPVLFASCAARLLGLAADRLRESPVA